MRRWIPLACLAAVLGLHVLLTLRYTPPSLVLGSQPISGYDFDMHYQQVLRALEAYRDTGHLWGYDARQNAGQLSGAIFDADNRLWEVWVIGLASLGVPTHLAYNLFVWLVHLMLPIVVYAASRLFRLEPISAVVATGLASLLWFFDALSHWCFFVGMIAWAGASYLFLLPLALFYRWTLSRSPLLLLAVLVALIVALLLHPYSFFLLVVPMGLLFLRAFRSLSNLQRASVVAVAAVTVLASLWWLRPALRFWHYLLNSAYFLDATASFLLWDYLGIIRDPWVQGVIAMRTAFRFLAWAGAAWVVFWMWRRERDDRYLPFLASFALLLGLSYLGGYTVVTRQVQPYRFLIPALFLAAIPAGVFLVEAARAIRGFKLPGIGWALLGTGALLLTPRFVRDVMYFLPELVPHQARPLPLPPPDINGSLFWGTIRWPRPLDFKHSPITDDAGRLADFVRQSDDGTGRWLVDWWMHGEWLLWSTDAQIIGGFREVNLQHSDANLFRRYPSGELTDRRDDPDYLRRYFEQYNVKWVVFVDPKPAMERLADLLEPVARVGSSRVYRVRQQPSWIVGGLPGTVRVATNHLWVSGNTTPTLVLKFHWMETLRCRPRCRLFRAEVPDDRVGFIGVQDAPAEFEIYSR